MTRALLNGYQWNVKWFDQRHNRTNSSSTITTIWCDWFPYIRRTFVKDDLVKWNGSYTVYRKIIRRARRKHCYETNHNLCRIGKRTKILSSERWSKEISAFHQANAQIDGNVHTYGDDLGVSRTSSIVDINTPICSTVSEYRRADDQVVGCIAIPVDGVPVGVRMWKNLYVQQAKVTRVCGSCWL